MERLGRNFEDPTQLHPNKASRINTEKLATRVEFIRETFQEFIHYFQF